MNTQVIFFTEKVKLFQIFNNFLSNSVKFTETSITKFRYNKIYLNLVMNVKDLGIRISKENNKYIFNQYRLNRYSTLIKYESAGWNLAIINADIKILHNKIWDESEIGESSISWF